MAWAFFVSHWNESFYTFAGLIVAKKFSVMCLLICNAQTWWGTHLSVLFMLQWFHMSYLCDLSRMNYSYDEKVLKKENATKNEACSCWKKKKEAKDRRKWTAVPNYFPYLFLFATDIVAFCISWKATGLPSFVFLNKHHSSEWRKSSSMLLPCNYLRVPGCIVLIIVNV